MGTTFQFAIVCFVLFFGLSQFFQWAKELSLPLPIFILGGAFLAIASNFDRRAGLPFNLLNSSIEAQTPTPPVKPEEPTLPESSSTIVNQPPRSISFTIRKSENQN